MPVSGHWGVTRRKQPKTLSGIETIEISSSISRIRGRAENNLKPYQGLKLHPLQAVAVFPQSRKQPKTLSGIET